MTSGAIVGERHGSGGPWEDRWGYSRVVRVGPLVVTAGCTATVEGRVQFPGEAGPQAQVAFGIALQALGQVGIEVGQVISTRMYITDAAHADAVGLVHGSIFGAVRPAAAMIVVAGFVDPDMLVEVEVTAWAGEEAST